MSHRALLLAASLFVLPALARGDDIAERADARVLAFEKTLWAPDPKPSERRFSQRPVAEQRAMVEAFFPTLQSDVEKLAFLSVGSSRYVYAIDRALFSEYAAKMLADPAPKVRAEAVHALAYNLATPHAPAIKPLLDDADLAVRISSLSTLGRLFKHDLLPHFADRAGAAANMEERAASLGAIAALLQDKKSTADQHQAEWAAVVAYLASDGPPVLQSIALRAVADSTIPAETAPQLDRVVALSRAADAKVRAAAIPALAKFDSPQAAAALRAALADSEANVRRAALRSPKIVKDPAAIADIVKMLSDTEAGIRTEAIRALAATHDPAHAPAIVPLLKDSSPFVREPAIEALEMLKAAASAPEIAALAKDSKESIRMTVARALGNLGAKEQIPALVTLATDSYYPTRLWAMRALVQFDAREHRAVLVTLTRDPESAVAEEARQFLAKWDAK